MFVAFWHFCHLFVLTNCSLIPCESSFGNVTWSPTGFQQSLCLGRFIQGSPKALYCFIQAEETTAWLCSWRRDCLARELKWQLNLRSWIPRWNLGFGEFLTWNFMVSFDGLSRLRVSSLVLSLELKTRGLGKSLKFAADREKTTKEVSYVKSMYSVQLHLGINEGQVF